MWDMNDIKTARHVRDHVLYIEFDNGTAGEIDLSDYLNRGPVFEPLADVEFFRQVRIVGGTVAWPNGADIAPESIYERVSSLPHAVREEKP